MGFKNLSRSFFVYEKIKDPSQLIRTRAMRVKGLEPSQSCPYKNLNLARLPIPPHPLKCENYSTVLLYTFLAVLSRGIMIFIYTHKSLSNSRKYTYPYVLTIWF